MSKKEITLVIADIRSFKGRDEEILPQIAPQYVEKYHRHKNPVDKTQELVAGYLLKQYLGVGKEDELTKNAHGKPLLTFGEKYFNLSHGGNYVALALAENEVGVDIEQVRPYHEATARRVFDETTYHKLQMLSGEARDRKFTELWTKLEAKLKFRGTGFGESLKKEQLDGGGTVTLLVREDCYVSCAADHLTDCDQIDVIYI